MNIESKEALKNKLGSEQVLYAVLDAAVDSSIMKLLNASDARFETYFPNAQVQNLLDYVPYLVEINANTSLLASLVDEFWQKKWCLYLSAQVSFDELIMHLESLVYIELPDGLNYFRFHDPRVLPDFLVTANNKILQQFFGPINSFMLENDEPETDSLLRFSIENQTLISERTALGALQEYALK